MIEEESLKIFFKNLEGVPRNDWNCIKHLIDSYYDEQATKIKFDGLNALEKVKRDKTYPIQSQSE